jgi:hypothetical protein
MVSGQTKITGTVTHWDDRSPSPVLNDLVKGTEIYLLLAEAKLELGDATGKAETFNIIRLRSNSSPITPSVILIDFILDECSRERDNWSHSPGFD